MHQDCSVEFSVSNFKGTKDRKPASEQKLPNNASRTSTGMTLPLRYSPGTLRGGTGRLGLATFFWLHSELAQFSVSQLSSRLPLGGLFQSSILSCKSER